MAPLCGLTGLVLTLAVSVSGQLSAVSWGEGRGDVFGTYTPYLYHKFYTGKDWQPATVEFLAGNATDPVTSDPTALAWNASRLDVFYTGTNASVYQRFYDGTAWKPDGPLGSLGQDLGAPPGGAVGPVAADNVGEWINLAVRDQRGSIWQKFYKPSARDWRPPGGAWERLGARMAGAPALVIMGNQVHYFGVGVGRTRIMLHKYWDGTQWVPPSNGWELFDGGPFAGEVTATSWGPDRFDIFAVGQDGALYQRYWQTDGYSDWKSLGGVNLTGAAQVTSRRPGWFDIIVPKSTNSTNGTTTYAYKAYIDGVWYPDETHFYDLSGTFAGPPGIVSWSDTSVTLFGVTSAAEELVFRFWWGNGWFPEDGSWQLLASLKEANASAAAAEATAAEVAGREGLRAQELR